METIKNSLKLPTTIEALGVPYQVKLVDVVDHEDEKNGEDCFGSTDGNLRIIKIRRDQGTRRQWTTLLHEIVHAVLYVNGVANFLDPDVEEIVAQSIEHSIEMFLRKHGKQLMEALEK